MTMAERIKEQRVLKGYTQEELGEKLGLQKAAIAKYESGRVENIKRATIAKMASIFECRPSYLMCFDDSDISHQFTLTDKEIEILGKYNALDATEKAMVEERMDTLLEKKTERMESVCG